MSKKKAFVFTETVVSPDAAYHRQRRDRTDATIRAGFRQEIDDDRLAQERARATASRAAAQRQTIERAVYAVMSEAHYALEKTFADPYGEGDDPVVSVLDLEGATLTVSMHDLSATATLTVKKPSKRTSRAETA